MYIDDIIGGLLSTKERKASYQTEAGTWLLFDSRCDDGDRRRGNSPHRWRLELRGCARVEKSERQRRGRYMKGIL